MSHQPVPLQLDTDLAVRHHGREHGTAPTLLFLHGLTDSGSGWPGAVAHWAPTYSVLAVDQRGHGESPRFTDEQLERHPGEVMVEDAVALLARLEEPPVVVGHSLGGAVALTCAVRRPDLVRALVLEDPAPLGEGQPQVDRGQAAALLDGVRRSLGAAGEADLVRIRREAHPDWAEDELLATGRGEQQMDLRYLRHGDFKPTTTWQRLFTELAVPSLVLTGDELDEVCIDETVEKGLRDLGNPRVTLARIQGAGHCVRREQPDRFYALVDAWLERH
jgi:pimeloyl-ACP methyl ester carboxylesterase